MSTRKRSGDDFDRELASHLELETEELIADGLAPDAARVAARRDFGNLTTARERFYEAGRRIWLDHLTQDVRCATRNMRRAPVASIVAIASLAAGIGATTVTLTVRDAVFHKPPPLYDDPAQLSRVQIGRPDRPMMRLGSHVPAALYRTWRDSFGSSIAATAAAPGLRDLRLADRTDTAPSRAVTLEFFRLLGVETALGQTAMSGGSVSNDARRALLSHGLWKRLFDGRSDVIGQVVWIDNQPHTITGVLPERFWFGDMNSPIWTLLDARALAAEDPLEVIVRRPPGTTPAMLEAQLRTGLADYAARLPIAERDLRLRVLGVEGTPIGNQVAVVLPYILAASVVLTLLIACANVAILMIAQWTAREHEIAIRASIGASRGRIVRSLLTESVVISAIGGVLGVCFTFALRGLVVRRGGEARFFDLSIDPGVLIQTALITLLTGVAAGLAPALYETRRLQVNPLRAMAGSDRLRQRWRSALVVFEITVTVALLVVTASMIDGYLRTRNRQMGYLTRPLLSARVDNTAGVPTSRILEVLENLPGVASAAAATNVVYATGPRVRAAADATESNAVLCERGAITAGFFSTLGVQIRAGRAFSSHDSGRLAIVNETLARQLFQGHDPLGDRIWIGGTSYDVVGVVADYRTNPMRAGEFEPKVYVPLPGEPTKEVARVHFLVRAEGDPGPLTQTIRREVRDAVPGTVVAGAVTIDQIFSIIGQEILVGTAPLVPLIVVGMLLTTAGIYGVLAFAISRRSRELAVRIAVGATGRDLVRLVSAHTLRLVVVGVTAGIAVTFGLSRIVRTRGGAGSIWDPGVAAFVLPVLIVIVIGALATWIPSRRVLRINPADLLRTT
jgi:putative ABC transport system permease protein